MSVCFHDDDDVDEGTYYNKLINNLFIVPLIE